MSHAYLLRQGRQAAGRYLCRFKKKKNPPKRSCPSLGLSHLDSMGREEVVKDVAL